MLRERKRTGFSLVEVLIVIIIIAILSGLIAITVRNPGAELDAGRLVSDIKTMKSAYIAFYADTHSYLPAVGSAGAGSDLVISLERYARKSLDFATFGPMTIQDAGNNGVYIGFAGGSTIGSCGNNTPKIYQALTERADAYGVKGTNGNQLAANGPILMRVR